MSTSSIPSPAAPRPSVLVDQQAEAFKRWFSQSGHWVYDYRAAAMETLRDRGIVGRPNWTPALGAALQSWVDADPLPGIINAARREIFSAETGGEA